MGIIRPATPGFLVTLVATILLAVVVFCVPYFKTIFFLKASITVDGFTGNITFGTLGYCLELTNGTTCSKPTIGYELDVNALLGVSKKLPVDIPQVAVKWITTALVLHVVALVAAAGSAVFGLLAHVREMSMACCSTFISGLAAVVAMLAFIFDLILFFVAKARINHVGSAQIGNAIWLTLAAWLLLFFSGCFYALGRCCISNRPRVPGGGKGGMWSGNRDNEGGPNKDYAEQMRLDAVKAEADRKARAASGPKESGLPAFYEAQPLTGHMDSDQVYVDGDDHSQTHLVPTPVSSHSRRPTNQNYAGGYAQAAPGTRTIDEYYNPTQAENTYPPQNRRDNSTSAYSANVPHSPMAQHAAGPSQTAYGASPYGGYNAQSQSPPPNNFLAPNAQYSAGGYGHTSRGSSYHTASPHQQEQSAYSQYDTYGAQPQEQNHYAEPSSYHDPYASASGVHTATPNPYVVHTPAPPAQQGYPERQYTLGGDGYGTNSVPPLPEHQGAYAYGDAPLTHSPPPQPAPINTNVGYAAGPISPIRGPRPQPGSMSHEESPPGYDPGVSGVTGNWGKQR